MNIFKDDNNWNEKAIVGFIAFLIMCMIMLADMITGWTGSDLVINEFVYDSFVWIVLGCFGISGVETFAGGSSLSSQNDLGIVGCWRTTA